MQKPSLKNSKCLAATSPFCTGQMKTADRLSILLHYCDFFLLAIANELVKGEKKSYWLCCVFHRRSAIKKHKPGLLFRCGDKSASLTIAFIWLYKKHLINRPLSSFDCFHLNINFSFRLLTSYAFDMRSHFGATTGSVLDSKKNEKFH